MASFVGITFTLGFVDSVLTKWRLADVKAIEIRLDPQPPCAMLGKPDWYRGMALKYKALYILILWRVKSEQSNANACDYGMRDNTQQAPNRCI